MGKEYEGVTYEWILCGVGSLEPIDSPELGRLFLEARDTYDRIGEEDDEQG